MMGHSCATRRAAAEFTITHHIPPPNLPAFSLFHMPGSAEYGWRRGHRKRDDKAKRGEGTIRSLTLLLSPQTRLRSCGTGINGIQLPGEMAAGSV